jgi:serine phosphatase RsbU (regulator of sigma subunit)
MMSDILRNSMDESAPNPATRFLVPIAGPAVPPIELALSEKGIVLGRHEECDVCLPADAEKVSRFHARFDFDGQRWRIADQGSRWGTYVNGIRLEPQVEVPLSDGDLVRITPWTFAFSASTKSQGVRAADDTGRTMIRTLTNDAPRSLADATMLALLLESAAGIHSATDERLLAEMIIDAAIRGTGMQNAAMVRPTDASGHVQIIASRFAAGSVLQPAPVEFSRSLINAALQGVVAEIVPSGMGDFSQSIVQLQIHAAICVPLMLGNTVSALLYLDSRGGMRQSLTPGASAFCVALGRMASLALANLKRVEMERRDAIFRAELAAAATAQKWIMPRREGRFGPFRTIGESRAGQYVGGDFFDIIPLDETRVAVAVGDVSGKGIVASVLMTATQGFLHAALKSSGDPALAVRAVNQFVNPRRPEGKFVTMWVGVFDVEARTLQYVDAGHGYALLRRADGSFDHLSGGGGIPIGVEEGYDYESERISIAPGDRTMIVSDGIIEQFNQVVRGDTATREREQFTLEGMRKSMLELADDPVEALFKAVIAHAGTDKLSDDATAVMVEWTRG